MRLTPGATIGIVSPAGPPDLELLDAGIELIRARGYRVIEADHVRDRCLPDVPTYLAGADRDRADDINRMLAREDVDAIICSRGGYGSIRLLDRIDWEPLRRRPRPFVGYSDVTSLHLAIEREVGIPTVYGPMVCSLPKLSDEAYAWFWKLLEGDVEALIVPTGDRAATIQTIVGGVARGKLAGGCLSLLAHACGSRWAPSFGGKIVVIEDIGEAIYRADRYLWQLKHAGALDGATGFVIGELTGWEKFEAETPLNSPETLVREFFGALGKPTVYGFPFGHVPDPLALPLGVEAQLDADNGELVIVGCNRFSVSPHW